MIICAPGGERSSPGFRFKFGSSGDVGTRMSASRRVGSVMSLLGTSTGRVFAAFLPAKMIQTFLTLSQAERLPDGSVRFHLSQIG
jgi:hypothetical protein